jgi:TP901 family phage tail tape measure protein
MSRSFNLTAELNLRGPSNIRPIIADIRRQLTGITANVNVTVNNTTTRNVNNLQQSVTRLNTALTATRGTATNATAALNAFARAAANVNNNIGNIPRNLTRINTGAGATTTTLNQVTRATQQATVGFEDFGRQSALAVRRFAAFATVTSVIYRFSNAVTSATSEFIDFNRELIRVAQVTDSSLSELRPLVSQITNLSTSLGVASKDLIQVSSTLAQAGLSARDTEKALRALALSALAPSFDSLSDTVEGSIALMRQFGISAGDLEDALGSVNSVAAKFAVEASDLITAIQRTGGVFATASKGVSEGKDALNEFLAVFTSIRATTRESAETIATGLRTIFTRIQRADTIDALKAFGVTLTDLEGKFVGPYEAVRRLSEGLSRLDPRDLRFSQIVEELGGFRQIGKVIPLIQQFATAQAALKVAQQGQGSLAKDASTAQQSLANQIAKVREEFTALIRSLGESSTFQTFVRLSLDLASALIRLADSAKTVLPALTAIAAFRGVSALTRFGAGFAGGLRRQNNGGPVRGFARGGIVPGVGSGDTVPAMLEAGEFVIRKKAVEKIGTGNLHKINKYATGGKVKDLLLDKPLLKAKYDTSNIEDLYSFIRIDRSKQNKLSQSREKYRDKAEQIWSQASSAYSSKGSLSGANTLIRRKTGINLPSKLSSKDLNPNNKDSQRLNKIQGSLAEKEVYNKMGNLKQLPTKAGADFTIGGSAINFVEVKNRLEPTSDNDLRGKALLGHQYLSGKQYLNNKLDKTPRLTISLFSSNEGDYKKKNFGGLIQKFALGGKGRALGARSKFKELDASELDKLSTADLIKYAKRQARDIFSTGGAGMAMRSRFIETPANKIIPELEPHLTSYMGKKGFWREEIAPFGRPSKQQAAKASKTGREAALKKQEARQADEVAARAQQWKLIRSGSKIDSYLLSSLKDPILSDYKSAKAGQPLAKAFHDTRLRQAVNQALDNYDDFDYSPAKIDKLVSGMASKRFAIGGSVEDKVPALLTPGEFVINKKAAGRIGASRLHQLNRADRIKGFNKGGAVGGIQKLAAGGFPTALTPAMSGLSAKETARLSSAIMNNVDAFNTLEAQVSALPTDQMLKAMRIFASKLEGGATDIDRAATEAATLAQSGGGGSRQSKKARVANSGVVVGPANPATGMADSRQVTNPVTPRGFAASQDRINQISGNVGQYQRGQDVVNRRDTVLGASSTVNLSNAGTQFAASLKNATTPLQMLTQAAKNAGTGLLQVGKSSLSAAGRGAGGLVSKIGGGALNMVGLGGLASKGAGAAMGGGGGGGMMGMVAMMAAGPLLEAASQSMGGEKTEAGRNTTAVGGAMMNYAAIGATLGSVIPGVGTALGGVVGAAAGLVVGLQDAKKANEEYAQSQREAKAATALDKSGKALEAYMAKPGAAQKQAFMSSFAATSEAEAAVKAGTKRQTASSFGKMLGYQDENINDFAARTAKTQTAGADQAKQFLTAEMMRTGKNFGEISKTMSPEQFKTLATNIAEADETYAYFQIQRANEIKKLRDSTDQC